jgi:hypothetical protein
MFKDLVVPKLEEHKQIILDLHFESGHFGEGCTLAKVNKCNLWHSRIDHVQKVVRACT